MKKASEVDYRRRSAAYCSLWNPETVEHSSCLRRMLYKHLSSPGKPGELYVPFVKKFRLIYLIWRDSHNSLLERGLVERYETFSHGKRPTVIGPMRNLAISRGLSLTKEDYV